MLTVNLAPLGLGELLDKTFSTFRKHFWLFAGIMVVPHALLVALNIIIQVTLHPVMFTPPQQNPQAAAQALHSTMHVILAGIAVGVPYYMFYILALGATTSALSEVYLGRTTTIREAYGVVRHRFWQLMGVILLVFLITVGIFGLAMIAIGMVFASLALLPKSLAWVTVLVGLVIILAILVGSILLMVFMLRFSLAIPALVLERLGAWKALKRSMALTKGFLWRLLIVSFVMLMIQVVVVSLCQSPFSVASLLFLVKGTRPSLWLTIPSVLLGGVVSTAVSPLLMISFVIAYYDLRVRKEGFDLQLMMSQLDQATPGALVEAQAPEGSRLEESSVLGVILLSFLTGGIYQPIWFLVRRKAFKRLNSPEKLGVVGLCVALTAFAANFAIPIVGGFVWGSSVQAENALGPVHPIILLIGGVIMVVQCFKLRRILLDHLAPQEEGMFSASIRFQYDDMLSRMGTFFLGIYYLQYKINHLLDRLTLDSSGASDTIPLAVAESLPPPMPT